MTLPPKALVGFAAGSFLLKDLAAAAVGTLPNDVTAQLQIADHTVVGPQGALDDPARAQIKIADRTWLLVVHDPDRPDVSVPILFGAAGIALAAVLGSLIYVWSREERMKKLQREADEDSLSGLRTRRRFEEEVRAAMARALVRALFVAAFFCNAILSSRFSFRSASKRDCTSAIAASCCADTTAIR